MKRLAWLPVLFAAGVTWGWVTGMAWPILNNVKAVLRPEPCNEADLVG